MAVYLNHTIVRARDREATADFYAKTFGFREPAEFGPFLVLETDNEVSLDVLHDDGEIAPQHYAFLVSESEFDEIFSRVREQGLTYWADPYHNEPGKINHNDGGRGVYFDDPNGHKLEIITRPYGSEDS
ncbi:cysteine transferase [Longimycelium tulufanense]|uniref:Cysteine transferase n=1 Tax=Longimycelium tulufanense TaxID=907463 RepID=A0A8J3CFB1_9PSEU|nr:VOC family protein [Longimycelium tulufanense]GGM58060.1 cysteine transferase [Longimycelium tulufanense]